MSEFTEKATTIQKEISLYHRKELGNRFDKNEQIKIENEWGASYLCAGLLEQSGLQNLFSFNNEKLHTLYEEFNKETGRRCDLNGLFARNWLRLVNDKVHIAGCIRFAVSDVEKVIGLDNEFSFCHELQSKYENKKISEEDFLKAVDEYQSEHDVILDLERTKNAYWFEIKDKQVKIINLIYYEPILKHTNDFLFIKRLYDLKKKDSERNLVISKENLSEILAKHRTAFPFTPSLETFIEKKVLTQLADGYTLNFHRNDIGFAGLVHDKTGALLWERLINNSLFKNDIERIKFWHDRIVYRNDWCNIGNFFESQAKARFLDSAMMILLNENDLSFGEDEFMKLKLDQGHRLSDLAYILSTMKNEPSFPTNSDVFELYEGLNAIDDRWQRNLMVHQGSREDLTYFINQIVRNDSEPKYERIFKLLEAGVVKPFLLWKTCFVIYYWKPAIIPFLVTNKLTASLAFSLLSETKGHNGIFNEKSDLYKDIACSNFQLLCDFLAQPSDLDNGKKARIIFQCLLTVENEKFTIVGPDLNKQQKHKKESSELTTAFQSIFESAALPGNYYSAYYSTKKLFSSSLLSELLEHIKNYSPVDYLKNNVITLPFVKLDMLAWILQVANKDNEPERDTLIYNGCNTFLNEYLEAINCGMRGVWDYETYKMVEGVPVWANQHPNIELINWKNILLALEKEKLLDDFINPPKLRFNSAKDRYDHFNSFVLNKIRTHISILLIAYNDLHNNKIGLAGKGLPISTALDKIESRITSLITMYCKDDPERGRLDIFSMIHERTFWSTDKEELLPVISNSLNRFKNENKTQIIKELIQNDQLVRAFKLLDYLVSEKDKEFLRDLITKNNIQQFFSTSNQNDAEFVLQRLAEEKEFKEKAKEALDILEHRNFGHLHNEKDHHSILCFRMKLLLAYHDLYEDKIVNIPAPTLHGSIESNRFSPYTEKDFYKALVFLQKDDPEKGYKIFDSQLKEAKEDRPTLALNRFAAKLQWAEQTKELNEKKKLFHGAIEEWSQFENKLVKDTYVSIEYIKDKIWYNKLHAYSGLKNEIDFDSEFNKLDKSFQLRQDFLELRIKNLMERKMLYQAETLLAEAEEYHRLSDGELPENILQLRELTNTKETETFLQDQYRRIFSKSPEELIKILPGNVNKFSSLDEFVLGEIVGAATDMLTFSNSVSDIKKEDKFSDLMVLSLVNRLRNFAWHIGPARGGFPESMKLNPGLIDYVIWSANKDRIAICEALQLKGVNRTEMQRHNFKVFNYDSTRKLYYIIVYFKGEGDKFKENWENYKTDITTIISFPEGFELNVGSLEDISVKFGTDSIMVAKSIHGSGTRTYHLFININYLRPKRGKDDKSKTIKGESLS